MVFIHEKKRVLRDLFGSRVLSKLPRTKSINLVQTIYGVDTVKDFGLFRSSLEDEQLKSLGIVDSIGRTRLWTSEANRHYDKFRSSYLPLSAILRADPNFLLNFSTVYNTKWFEYFRENGYPIIHGSIPGDITYNKFSQKLKDQFEEEQKRVYILESLIPRIYMLNEMINDRIKVVSFDRQRISSEYPEIKDIAKLVMSDYRKRRVVSKTGKAVVDVNGNMPFHGLNFDTLNRINLDLERLDRIPDEDLISKVHNLGKYMQRTTFMHPEELLEKFPSFRETLKKLEDLDKDAKRNVFRFPERQNYNIATILEILDSRLDYQKKREFDIRIVEEVEDLVDKLNKRKALVDSMSYSPR